MSARNAVPIRQRADGEDQIIERALEILARRCAPGELVTSPGDIKKFLRLRLGGRKNEGFGAVFLTSQHRVLCLEDLFSGTIDAANVHPRVVVQRALEANAAAVILYHNHPSGLSEPSVADLAVTARLRESLALIDVRLLDHFILTADDCYSLAERGLI